MKCPIMTLNCTHNLSTDSAKHLHGSKAKIQELLQSESDSSGDDKSVSLLPAKRARKSKQRYSPDQDRSKIKTNSFKRAVDLKKRKKVSFRSMVF